MPLVHNGKLCGHTFIQTDGILVAGSHEPGRALLRMQAPGGSPTAFNCRWKSISNIARTTKFSGLEIKHDENGLSWRSDSNSIDAWKTKIPQILAGAYSCRVFAAIGLIGAQAEAWKHWREVRIDDNNVVIVFSDASTTGGGYIVLHLT